MAAALRIITWNCHSGSVEQLLDDLAEYQPDVVFLQECTPLDRRRRPGLVCSRRINGRKAVALFAASDACRCRRLRLLSGSGNAAIGATVVTPLPFTAIGIWAQKTDYVEDVMRTVRAHRNLLRAAPAVVMGDFNSGTSLTRTPRQHGAHRRLLDEFHDLGLVSAYHVYHGIDHGDEAHATYFHLYKTDRPWHIDFCFVPQAWTPRLANVAVLDGDVWARRSDHRPLLVDLTVTP
jgi:endonuclease/exonuclease/phosphatase family metal-dependent hydrolase